MNAKQLKELGFESAAKELSASKEFNRKTCEAYAFYKIVRQEHIDKFNEESKKNSLKESGTAGKDLYHAYDKLCLTNIKEYKEVPPEPVLTKLKEARDKAIFDSFEIMKIESVKEYKDPILFGRIIGCTDLFFIAEWDEDIKMKDLIGE